MNLEIIFDNLQKEADILYEEYGAIDDIIQLQIAINSLRNKFDIMDKKELTQSNKRFVQ